MLEKKEAATKTFANPLTIDPYQVMVDYNIPVRTFNFWNGTSRKIKHKNQVNSQRDPIKVKKQHKRFIKRFFSKNHKLLFSELILPGLVSNRERDKWTFMQDNAPAHNAWITKRYLREVGIKVADHQAGSPDLNPIEKVWVNMKREVVKYEFKNTKQISQKLLEVGEGINQERINTRIFRLRRKIKEVMRLNEKISETEILHPRGKLLDETGIHDNNPSILGTSLASKMKILARQPEEERERLFAKMMEELNSIN